VPSVRTPAGYRGYTDADIERLQRTIKAVEELMNARRKGIQLTAEEQVEIFGTTAFGEEYAAEAGQRWGERDAWKQSLQRVSQYSKQDWIATKAEGDAGSRRWRRPSAVASNPDPLRRTSSRPGTARRSSGPTTAMTRFTAIWCRSTWPTNGSPGTTTTSSPGWRNSSMTSWWPVTRSFLYPDVSWGWGMTGHLPSGTVTFLLTDLEGSTRIWEQDPEAMKPRHGPRSGCLRSRQHRPESGHRTDG